MIFKDIAEYEDTDSQLSKDTILRLHKEIEELKDLCDKYEEEHRTVFEEWKKTINIINELEKWLNEWKSWIDRPDEFEDGIISCINDTLDKIKELKGVNKE